MRDDAAGGLAGGFFVKISALFDGGAKDGNVQFRAGNRVIIAVVNFIRAEPNVRDSVAFDDAPLFRMSDEQPFPRRGVEKIFPDGIVAGRVPDIQVILQQRYACVVMRRPMRMRFRRERRIEKHERHFELMRRKRRAVSPGVRAVFVKFLPVVAGENDDGVFEQPAFPQVVKNASEQAVEPKRVVFVEIEKRCRVGVFSEAFVFRIFPVGREFFSAFFGSVIA